MKPLYSYILLSLITLSSVAADRTIRILHTNDTHSQVEPFFDPATRRYYGGSLRRMAYMIGQKQQYPQETILVDGGDFCQGTPYFNIYKGAVEVALMNRTGYDVVTLGNHEFDYGVDHLATLLSKAKFEVVCSNVDFSNSPLKQMVKPYVVIQRSGVRVGVFGLLVNPDRLIDSQNFTSLIWKDPTQTAKLMVQQLRQKEQCDIVVLLSHLGNKDSAITDSLLATQVEGIDIIVGGHSHQLITPAIEIEHDGSEDCYIQQMGSRGGHVGLFKIKLEDK